MKRFLSGAVLFYQRYISPLLPRSCRYYPTCSEYALWQLRFSSFIPAVWAIVLRILRCNQLFKGGIDYPVIKRNFEYLSLFRKNSHIHPEFWFVPCSKNKYYLIKVFDSSKEK